MISVVQTAFWLSSLLLVYVFVGYPLCVWCLARLFPQEVCKQTSTPTVTIVMAVFDGAALIQAKLVNLLALDYPPERIDIIIVCDDAGSFLATGSKCWNAWSAGVRQRA
jgi:cellulose synthase/poly-beta-1,6-N-acetylglucosamine synthase-like glycosyltransferase